MWEFRQKIDPKELGNANLVITREGIFLISFVLGISFLGLLSNNAIFFLPGITLCLTFLYFILKFVFTDIPELDFMVGIPSSQIKAKQFLTVYVSLSSEANFHSVCVLKHSTGLVSVLRSNRSVIDTKTSAGTTFILYAPRRGREWINSISLEYMGIPGLFYVQSRFELEKKIIVLPQPQRVTLPWTMKQRIFEQFIAEISISRRGRGDEFLSLRDFQFGDELRHIHWKASAKHNKLITKEFEEPIMLRFLIVVDKSLMMSGPKLEFVLSSVVELASVIRRSNHSLTILVHGDLTTWKFSMGSSPSSFNLLGIHLHEVRSEGPEFNFKSLKDYIINHSLNDTVMIILSDLEHKPETIREGYSLLRPHFQRLLYFACFTPGFGTLAYNQVTGENIETMDELYYRKFVIKPKLQRIYAERDHEYSIILTKSRSKYHLIQTYNTNILLELRETLDRMHSSLKKTRGVVLQ